MSISHYFCLCVQKDDTKWRMKFKYFLKKSFEFLKIAKIENRNKFNTCNIFKESKLTSFFIFDPFFALSLFLRMTGCHGNEYHFDHFFSLSIPPLQSAIVAVTIWYEWEKIARNTFVKDFFLLCLSYCWHMRTNKIVAYTLNISFI